MTTKCSMLPMREQSFFDTHEDPTDSKNESVCIQKFPWRGERLNKLKD